MGAGVKRDSLDDTEEEKEDNLKNTDWLLSLRA
jgi:hypothetical protein